MAKFLNSSGVYYHLEELIKTTGERLHLISPYLKFNDRIRELLEDKDRLKIDIRLVYGKGELHPDEMAWLRNLSFVRTSFCRNLHAKCYMNENLAIVTSMNLYEFSQVNNNEMGVLISRLDDPELFRETDQEVRRLIRISEEIKVTVEKVPSTPEEPDEEEESAAAAGQGSTRLISTTQLSKKLNIPLRELYPRLQKAGLLVIDGESRTLTDKARTRGAQLKTSPKFGTYAVWPENLDLNGH